MVNTLDKHKNKHDTNKQPCTQWWKKLRNST